MQGQRQSTFVLNVDILKYLGDSMATIDSKVYTEDEFLDIYRKQYGDGIDTWGRTNPMGTRRERGLNKYSLSDPQHYLAFDGDKLVGYVAYNDNDTFIHHAGVSVHQDYRKRDIGGRLLKVIKNIIIDSGKPALVTLNTKSMDVGTWKGTFIKMGYIDSPEYSELNEETKRAIPPEVIDYENSAYGKAWMLRPIGNESINKSEYFNTTSKGEPIEPILQLEWLNTIRGSNMKNNWRDIIKFKGRFDDDEDEKDKQGKEPMPVGGSPPKKPKDKSEKGKIFEDSNPSNWKGDWRRRKGIDPITGKKTNAGEMARETEIVGTDSPCCAEIRQLLKDYMELIAKPNPVTKKNIENWIDANIPCVDIEKAMAFRGPNIGDGKTLTYEQQQDTKANAGIDDKRGFTIPMEFDDEEQELYFPNPKTIRIEAHTPNFFRTVAGKLTFIPEKKWAFKDPNARSPSQMMQNGKGYTLGMHFNDCISGKQKNPMTAANTLDNEDFYADMATTQEKYLVEMKEIIDAYQLRGGNLGRGGQPNVRQMQKEMPDLYRRWQRISQISQSNQIGQGELTEDEMNANEKARERLWDYLEEMSGKKIDRNKLRRENPLDDYEYYTGEEEDD